LPFFENIFRDVGVSWYPTEPEGPMTRVVSVGRSRGLLTIGALGSALLTLCLAGCPGTLDSSQFPPMTSGAAGAGNTSGAAGMTGAAGMMVAAAGMSGTGTPGCDITPLVATYMCAKGGCHDDAGMSAGFSMTGNTWWMNLVGVTPKGGGTFITSVCSTSTTPYITKGSATGDGLFLDKVKEATPPCGAQMPFGGPTFPTTQEVTCFQQFTTALANM
jgi:hypothetical protein